MKIRKLPADTRSKLQTGIVITDAVQCVIELVHNSLDAEATAIAVKINLKLYQIEVIDNGKGIQKDDLELVGERFMTSKYHNLDDKNTSMTYGFKGQAISSILDVCKSLTIKTKPEEDGPCLIKEFQNNEALPITETDAEGCGMGTIIVVEDFMCNMPVRRKRINEVFDIEEMKTQLQYLAVIHHNVCFTLRNDNKGTILFQKNPAESILKSISNTFGKTIAKHLKPVQYQDKNFEISGFIALKPQKQNNLQLFYLNKRIITKGVIHKFVNNLMKECMKSTVSLGDSPLEKDILKKMKNSFHNVFVLFMICPLSFYELFTNSRKVTVEFQNWKEALKCLNKAIKKMYTFDYKSIEDIIRKIEPIPETKAKFGTSLLINAIRGAPVKRNLRKPNNIKGRKNKKVKQDKSSEISSFTEVVDLTNDSLKSPVRAAPRKKALNKLNNSKRNKTDMSYEIVEDQGSTFDVSTAKNSIESSAKKTPLKEKDRKRININRTHRKIDKSLITVNKEVSNFTFNKNEAFKSPIRNMPNKTITNAKRRKVKDITFLAADNQDSTFHNTKIECTNDSFESPIPRIQLRNTRNFESKKYKILNSSFFKFYEWLKMKFESEKNALNLYKSFIQSEKESITNSPIFLRNNRKLINESKKRFAKNDCGLNKPKRFHILREETTETHTFLPLNENMNLNAVNEKITNQQSSANKRLCLPSSPATSEIIFTNLIKLRNLSESFPKPADREKSHHNVSNTWKSHYRNSTTNVYKEPEDTQRDICENYEHESYNFNKRRNYGLDFDFPVRGFDMFSTERVKQFRDAQTETDIIYPEKVSVSVQTDIQMIPETPEDEQTNQETEGVLEVTFQMNPNGLSQEVPNPDFWNFPTPQNPNLEMTIFQVESNPLEIATSSSEFVCAQISSSNKLQENSSSKETQTLAEMWTDCLQELGTENSASLIESNLAKTIPVVSETSDFCLTERHDFIPKGLSPKFVEKKSPVLLVLSSQEKKKIKSVIDKAENEILDCIKWQDESTGISTKPSIPVGIIEEMLKKKEKNLFYYQNEILSASMSYCAVKIHNLLHSFAFTKELLSNVEIVGQLDKKFIVAKMKVSVPKIMNLIAVFDQHAVDERIRLEEILQAYITSDGKLISSCVNPPIECLTTKPVIEAVSNFENKLMNFGLNVEILNENTLSFNEIPAFLLDKYEKNLKTKNDDVLKELLQNLITDVVKELSETRGASSKIPKILHNAFCMEACRKAIKFNRFLTKESMDEIINKLRNCKLPFQCAHGRPSVIPIIDLEDFKSMMTKKPEFDWEKLKKFVKERKQNLNSTR